ncbi:hypothetical protein HN681_00990 [archaeon]|jgi:DNA-directed RNA polymerase subunit F|nr:hypothetical protein [archaeon]MBT3730591.1 hypothetical protein [archaeon]MBT4669493.1 hypothetical protein [archaeon]MBT5030250.1 hypothetical protein [archaeon]MBT5287651.1 hypothetical protein [archaeon]
MGEFEIIEEKPISLITIKEKLAIIEEERGELSFRAEKTKAYLENFCQMDEKDVEKIKEDIINLNIPRLKDRQITKIVDICPKDLDSLKLLFSGEILTISEEDMKKILDVIPQ